MPVRASGSPRGLSGGSWMRKCNQIQRFLIIVRIEVRIHCNNVMNILVLNIYENAITKTIVCQWFPKPPGESPTPQGPPRDLPQTPKSSKDIPDNPGRPPGTHQVRPSTPKDPQGPRKDHQWHQKGGTSHPLHQASSLQALVASAESRSAINLWMN